MSETELEINFNQEDKYMKLALVLEYTRKDFFNNYTYTKDEKRGFTKNDLIKSFTFFSKNQDAVIQIGNTVMFWDGSENFERKTVSVRFVGKEGVSGGIIPFDMLKQAWYKRFRNQAAA